MIQKNVTEIQPIHTDLSALVGKGVLLFDRQTGEAVALDASVLGKFPSFELMKSRKFSQDYSKNLNGWTRSYNLCLRFRGFLPPDDWMVEYYMYNNEHNKTQWKLVDTHTIGECTRPYEDKEAQLIESGKDHRYFFCVTPRSLVDLFFNKFVPEGLTPKGEYDTAIKLRSWSDVIQSNGVKGAWRYGDSTNPYISYDNKAFKDKNKFTGNFGIRLVSRAGDMVGQMIPFVISITTLTSEGGRGVRMITFALKSRYGTV